MQASGILKAIGGIVAPIANIFSSREIRRAEEAKTEGIYAQLLSDYGYQSRQNDQVVTLALVGLTALLIIVLIRPKNG